MSIRNIGSLESALRMAQASPFMSRVAERASDAGRSGLFQEGAENGSVKKNVEPTPNWLSAQMLPS